MARKYRVHVSRPNGLPDQEHTYHGFNRTLDGAECIAVVASEGEVEVFALDVPVDASGLNEYLKTREDGSHVLGYYKRTN